MDDFPTKPATLINLGGLILRSQTLITDALLAYAERADSPDDSFDAREAAREINRLVEEYHR
ncbi:hypothetical protein [Streptomyces sp. NPDC048411]|uniref:hypothetical protein n=1 Tax=Streptomyces sp. NPDC048411 TaxID=3157206 RepID=UPI0034568BCD